MLRIERQSPFSNKLVTASVVFAVGFIGALSTLGLLRPGLETVSFGRPQISAGRTSTTESSASQADKAKDSDQAGNSTDAATGDSGSKKAEQVEPASIGQPASQFTAPEPKTGSTATSQAGSTQPVATSQSGTTVSGVVASPAPTAPATAPTSPTAPSSQPAAPTTSSPITSLTQPVTETASNLLPSLSTCTCAN